MTKEKHGSIGTYVKSLFILAIMAVTFTQLGMMYHEDIAYIDVSVHNGDTIWKIASIAADNKTDVREVVSEIIYQNGLGHDGYIHPGQVLKVPVEESKANLIKQQLRAQ